MQIKRWVTQGFRSVSIGLLIALIIMVGLPYVCCSEDEEESEKTSPGNPIPEVSLDGALRFVVRPTIFGLVPPPDESNYGEVFVRVREVFEDGSIGLYYEIKEEVPRTRGENESTRRKLKPRTTIRRGFVSAQREEKENYIIPPLFWHNGDFGTESGLMWLTRQQMVSLKLTSQVVWDVASSNGMSEQTQADFKNALDDLSAEPVSAGASEAVLKIVDDSASYPVVVNGARIRLPAIRVIDSLGLAEYWILDNLDNPLVLKLTYISNWATGGTVGEQGYSIFNGGGFAVVEIDF